MRITMSSDVLRRMSSSRPRSKPRSPPQCWARFRWSSSTSWAGRLLRSSIMRSSFASLNTPITTMLAREQAQCTPRTVIYPSAWKSFLRSSRQAESGGIMLIDGNGDSLSKCSERREVSEEDNNAVVRRWIETFNNPYTPQTEVDVLTPGYVALPLGPPGPLDLVAWS